MSRTSDRRVTSYQKSWMRRVGGIELSVHKLLRVKTLQASQQPQSSLWSSGGKRVPALSPVEPGHLSVEVEAGANLPPDDALWQAAGFGDEVSEPYLFETGLELNPLGAPEDTPLHSFVALALFCSRQERALEGDLDGCHPSLQILASSAAPSSTESTKCSCTPAS